MNTYSHSKTVQVAFGLLLGSCLVPTQADYAAKVLSNSPVAYWRLNEKATAPAADVAKNLGSLGVQADGHYLGASLHPATGLLTAGGNSAASFDATSGTFVGVTPQGALSPTNAFTVEFWAQPNATLAADDSVLTCPVASLFRYTTAPANNANGWIFYQGGTGWQFRAGSSSGYKVSISGTTDPVAGSLYHLVATFDGTTVRLYVNGIQEATGTPSGILEPNTTIPLGIGARGDNAFLYDGTVDEVAVYPTALAASEVLAHYQNGTSASPATAYKDLVLAQNPLAYYRLDEGAYTAPSTLPVAKNAVSGGTAYDGSYNPGVNSTAEGPRPPAASGFEAGNTGLGLNGVAGFVGTPFSLNDLAKFTVMGWIRRGTAHSGRGGYFGQNDLLELGDVNGGAGIETYINAHGGNIIIPFPFRDNEWGLFTVVADGTQVIIYTNGVAAASAAKVVDTYGSSTYGFNIGGGGIFNATGDVFLGNIDEVAVFDKALTAEQVLDTYYAANVPPTITAQPVAPDRQLFEGNPVTLSVVASGTPTLQYQWRKDGADLSGKTLAELAFPAIKVADAGAYDVVVHNDYGMITSAVVNLSIKPADTNAPTLSYATANRTFNKVRVWFSEPLDTATAENASNYTLSGGLTVTSAKLSAPAGSAGDNIVDLVTTAQTPGQTYTLTVSGVKDQASPANTIVAGSTLEFSAWTLVTGYLTFEHWDNITGAADSDIDKALEDPRVVADNPTTFGFVSGRFDIDTIFTDDSHENYFAKVTGWITPKESGDYYFFLRSDDASRLYLSANETLPNPASDTPIATEPTCCRAFLEPESGEPVTTASPIPLQAGKRYGVLAMVKEGGGGDNLMVAWRKSTDTTLASVLPYLPGQYLSTYVDPNADLKFTKQPTDQLGVVPSPVVEFISKDFKTTDGGFTVVNTEKAPPGPWTYDAAAGVWTADGGESDCTGPYNSQLISPEFVVPVTEEVAITFVHRYSFESDSWDGGQLRISVNGGEFTPVPAENYTANGYAVKPIQGNGVLINQRAFNADSPGYAAGEFITSSAILGSFKQNDKIVLSFVGAWDDCSIASQPSWVIKSVKLAYGKAPQPVTFESEAVATRQGQATAFGYQWQRNDGTGFVDIALDSNGPNYRFFPAAADFNATFRVVASVPGKALNSNTVKVVTKLVTTPTISVQAAGGGLTVTYTGTLQSSATVNGTYQDVGGATSPYSVANPSGTMFFRAVAK